MSTLALPALRPAVPSLAALSLALLLAACGSAPAAPQTGTGSATPPTTSPSPSPTPTPTPSPTPTPMPGDTTNPNVTLSAAQNGTAVTLSAAATDNVGVSRVEFYRGAALIATDTSEPYSTSLTVSSADNGSMGFTARAYDAAGNAGSGSTSLNVYVAPPTTTPAPSPTPGKTLYQGVWSWSATDLAGNVVGQGTLTLNGETAVQGRTLATGTYRTDAGTQNGYAGLGPLQAAGNLDVALTYTADPASTALYLTASDSDKRLDTQNGQAVFSGPGFVLDRTTQQPQRQVVVTLRQLSAEVSSGRVPVQSAALTGRPAARR